MAAFIRGWIRGTAFGLLTGLGLVMTYFLLNPERIKPTILLALWLLVGTTVMAILAVHNQEAN